MSARIQPHTRAPNRSSHPISIIYRPLADLKPDPRNPRLHDKRQVKQIARSITAFGFNVPILVDRDLNVIAGHGRLLAAMELGIDEVPTILLEHLTEAQAKAFMIADNRLTDTSVWDDHLLGEQLKVLSELDLDFDLEATGFTMGEIDMRIEGLGAEGPDPADELPDDALGPPVSKPGDIWVLGKHRVLCCNALETASYATLLDDEQAAAVITDAPYNVKISGNVSGLGRVKHREFAMASGEMSEAEFAAFLSKSCRLLSRFSRDGALVFLFMDWRHARELLDAGTTTFGALLNLCVWTKSNAGMGSLYRSQHELVFVFRNGKAPHRNNVELGKHGRHRSNVWNYPNPTLFGRSGEEGKLLSLHPTVKPVALIADAIMDSTARGDIVLDPFLGSGTTVLAAERTGRRCFGIEIDPAYVDVVVRRWQSHTRQQARHAVTGKLFDTVASEAGND